jgi:peptide deformylase
MRHILSKTGGAGIAANQCEEFQIPLNIVLVGVDYNNPEHIAKVVFRYPSALFPPVKTYINLTLSWTSQELDVFPEGCLSVQGPMRALVLRPRDIKIRYQDMEGNYHDEQFTGDTARVILHELDHISEGKVYFQRVLEELKIEDLEYLQNAVRKIKSSSRQNKAENLSTTPTLAFKRNANNDLIFATDEIENLLEKSNTAILDGIYWALSEEIRIRGA